MRNQTSNDAVVNCEDAINWHKTYLIEHKIQPRCVDVANRLLNRRIELFDLYIEVNEKLNGYPRSLRVFFDDVLLTTAYWNPEENRRAREERAKLKEINKKIAAVAAELSSLIERRSALNNTSGFCSNTHFSVCSTLNAAGGFNFLYQSHVQAQFEKMYGQFDSKYWPNMTEFLSELARDALEADVYAHDEITDAATISSHPSLKDFLRALIERFAQNSFPNGDFFPKNFILSDASMASLLNCALDQDWNNVKDAAYVKRFRQGERERKKREEQR